MPLSEQSVRALVAPFDLAKLEADPATVYAVDDALVIRFVNRAWHTFAAQRGAADAASAWGVGSHVLDAISPDLKPFYEELFRRAAESEQPLEHTYECPSPTHDARYRMRVLRCAGGHVVVHALAYWEPHPQDPSPPSDAAYRDADGLMHQCSHCRRVRRAGSSPAQWDWVGAFVRNSPARTSHALCAVCVDYYYAQRARIRASGRGR